MLNALLFVSPVLCALAQVAVVAPRHEGAPAIHTDTVTRPITAADTAWVEFTRKSTPPARPLDADPVALLRWTDMQRQVRQEAVLHFATAYPNDPRWLPELLWCLNYRPNYWADYEEAARMLNGGGYELARVDTATRNARRRQYSSVRAAFLASPHATADDRRRLRLYELRNDINDMSRGLPGWDSVDFRGLQDRFLAYAEEFGAAGGISNYANALLDHKVLRSDRKNASAFVERAKTSSDTALRAWAMNMGALLSVGDRPFPLRGTSVEGTLIDLAQFRGKVVFVDFWGTGCSSCIAALPRYKTLYAKYHPLGVEFLGVVIDDEAQHDQIRHVIAQHQVTWPQIFTGAERDLFWKKYALTYLPKHIIVDQQGRLVTMGSIADRELEGMFRELLAQRGDTP